MAERRDLWEFDSAELDSPSGIKRSASIALIKEGAIMVPGKILPKDAVNEAKRNIFS